MTGSVQTFVSSFHEACITLHESNTSWLIWTDLLKSGLPTYRLRTTRYINTTGMRLSANRVEKCPEEPARWSGDWAAGHGGNAVHCRGRAARLHLRRAEE